MSTWLTPGRRQAIQAAGATIVTALAGAGLMTGGQAETVTALIAQALGFLMAAMSLAHLDRTQAATWLEANLRGAVYGLAGAVAAAAMAFGLIGEDRATRILSALSLVLTILQALISIVNAPVDATPPIDEGGLAPRHAATTAPAGDATPTVPEPGSGAATPHAPGGATAVPAPDPGSSSLEA